MKARELVRLTSKGKVSITLPAAGTLKPFFVIMLEKLMTEVEYAANTALSMDNAAARTKFALLSEVYLRHMMTFNLVTRQDVKVLLTIPQAIAIWELSQDYSSMFISNPEMGNLLMQLHQKLC